MIQLDNKPSIANAMKHVAQYKAQNTKTPAGEKPAGASQALGGGVSLGVGNVVLMMLAVAMMSMQNMNSTMSTSSNELDLQRGHSKSVIIKGQELANKPVPTSATVTDGASADLAETMIETTEFEAAGQQLSSSITLQSTNLSNTAEEYMAQYLIGLSALQLYIQYAVAR